MGEHKERKGLGVKIGSYAIIAFILVYLPSVVVWVSGRQINTSFLRSGSLEDIIQVEACVVRDEKIIKSPVDGKCIFDISEGEKVAANYRIATILKDSAVQLMSKLYELDLDIIKKQKEKGDIQEIFSEDVVKLDNEISKKVVRLAEINNQKNFSEMAAVKAQIDDLVQKKAQIIGSKSVPDTYIQTLIKQRDTLAEQIKTGTNDIISDEPGIVSYITDGYEQKLTPTGIKNLVPGFIEEIKKDSAKKNWDNTDVTAGSTIAKLIRDIDYYFVITLDKNYISNIELNSEIRIRVNEIGKDIIGKIDYISKESNGSHIVSIRVNKSQYETLDLRVINIELITNYYQGLKIPLKSLKSFNLAEMKAEIVLVKAGYASIRPVLIKGMNEEFAIIEKADTKNSVNLYDVYIVNPENIEEGQGIDNE